MKISIIVPCYNEVENIAFLYGELLPVIEDLINRGWEGAPKENLTAELILVDDGSQDGTLIKMHELFDRYKNPNIEINVIQHTNNLVLGAEIRTGFTHANGDIIITLDSDGTYKFTEIPALLSCLKANVDIVTASPYHPGGNVVGIPANRLILSRGSSLIYRVLVEWDLYTYTCLFRAYRSKVIKNIHFEANDFLAGTELLVKAILDNYKVAEFPAVLYRRTYGVSKAKIFWTIRSHLKFQCWVLIQRLRMLV